MIGLLHPRERSVGHIIQVAPHAPCARRQHIGAVVQHQMRQHPVWSAPQHAFRFGRPPLHHIDIRKEPLAQRQDHIFAWRELQRKGGACKRSERHGSLQGTVQGGIGHVAEQGSGKERGGTDPVDQCQIRQRPSEHRAKSIMNMWHIRQSRYGGHGGKRSTQGAKAGLQVDSDHRKPHRSWQYHRLETGWWSSSGHVPRTVWMRMSRKSRWYGTHTTVLQKNLPSRTVLLVLTEEMKGERPVSCFKLS
jgi:hypothetical protein